MRLASLLPKVRQGPLSMPARQALELATLGGAAALGLSDQLGSLEAGKRADLVVLNLQKPHSSPGGDDIYGRIVYSARATDVEQVVVDGRTVVRNGRLVDHDAREVALRAEVEAKRVTQGLA